MGFVTSFARTGWSWWNWILGDYGGIDTGVVFSCFFEVKWIISGFDGWTWLNVYSWNRHLFQVLKLWTQNWTRFWSCGSAGKLEIHHFDAMNKRNRACQSFAFISSDAFIKLIPQWQSASRLAVSSLKTAAPLSREVGITNNPFSLK